jgi:hypothetical protein
MISEVSICNQALSWLGHTPINSLQDNSTAAQLCRDNYEFLRDAVLEEHMWTFATVRAASETAIMVPNTSLYQHGKPVEWLQVYRVYQDEQFKRPVEWRMEETGIVTEHSTIYMWGIKRITDTGKFSIMFSQAVAARMAADLAIALTENRQLQADMWALYKAKVEEASTRDGQQGSNDYVTQHGLVGARFGGGSYLL